MKQRPCRNLALINDSKSLARKSIIVSLFYINIFNTSVCPKSNKRLVEGTHTT